jgi:hypothetical protein
MNIKMTLAVLVALTSAVSASAQVASIRPVHLGVNAPAIRPFVNLAAPLTAALAPTASLVQAKAAIPVLPAGVLPKPTSTPVSSDSPEAVAAPQDRLENLFDGRTLANRKHGPVRAGRRMSLPEQDLEREIGSH